MDIIPSQPWPRPPHKETLDELVTTGNTPKLRDFFNDSFWQGAPERPDWNHVKAAVLREDREIVRLVVTYYEGTPTPDNLAELKRDAGDKYPQSLNLLRQCGLNIHPSAISIQAAPPDLASEKPVSVVAPTPVKEEKNADFPLLFDKIPNDWKILLLYLQQKGAPEAVIAGGALRDLLNERPIKDVDIFLRGRGSPRKNKAYLKECFNSAGFKIKGEITDTGSSIQVGKKFPDPESLEFQTPCQKLESWSLHAARQGEKQATNYNVIFVTGKFKWFGWDIINSFDLGICQIMYDDTRDIKSTRAFWADQDNKRISLINEHDGTKDHLLRVSRKYPDFKLCEKSKNILELPDPPRPRKSWY